MENLEWWSVNKTTQLDPGVTAEWMALGYDGMWRVNEKRLAPASLVARSNVTLAPVSASCYERKYVKPVPGKEVHVSPEEYKERFAGEGKVKVKALTNGWTGGEKLSVMLGAIGYVLPWRLSEVREIPVSIWDEMKRTGDARDFTTKAEDLEAGIDNSVFNRLAYDEREAVRTRRVQENQEGAILAEIDRLLAIEQAEKIAKLRKIAVKNLGL